MSEGAASGVFERTIERVLVVVRQSLYAERSSSSDGLLQRRDARAKLIAAVILLLGMSLSRSVAAIAAAFGLVIAVALVSRVRPLTLARAISFPVLFIGTTLALPALFVTHGTPLVTLPLGVAITDHGLTSASFLIARLAAGASVALVLVLTTPWPLLLNALRALGLPPAVVVIFGMTYRYIFLLLKMSHDMFVARRSRMLAVPRSDQSRAIVVRTAGVLFARSLDESQRIYEAMASRGFRGDVRLLTPPRMRAEDWALLVAALVIATVVAMAGRIL